MRYRPSYAKKEEEDEEKKDEGARAAIPIKKEA